jgi:ribonucleotide monophosphatase NagD (HAD superfamily)
LVIGDNLNTDIRGANNMHYDSLFIKNGIHNNEFKNLKPGDFDEIFIKYQVKINYYQNHLSW